MNSYGEYENSIDDKGSDKSLRSDAAEIVDDPETISGGAPMIEAEAQRVKPNAGDTKNKNQTHGDKNTSHEDAQSNDSTKALMDGRPNNSTKTEGAVETMEKPRSSKCGSRVIVSDNMEYHLSHFR